MVRLREGEKSVLDWLTKRRRDYLLWQVALASLLVGALSCALAIPAFFDSVASARSTGSEQTTGADVYDAASDTDG